MSDEQQKVVEEFKRAAAQPRQTIQEAIRKSPNLARGVFRFYFSQVRNVLAFLYNGAIDARSLLGETRKRFQPLETIKVELKDQPGIAGVFEWLKKYGVDALDYWPFALAQEASANIYAAILLFEVDKLIRQLKKTLALPDVETGPMFAGQPFSRIVRAAGNQYRHAAEWADCASLDRDDATVLKRIGVADVTSASVPSDVLAIIGGSNYFEFEANVQAAVFELLEKVGHSESGESEAPAQPE